MTAVRRSRLLVGRIAHRRLAPRPHAFAYPLFLLDLDLDELPAIAGESWLLGTGRGRPLRLDVRDHLGLDTPAVDAADAARRLRMATTALLAAHGVTTPLGRVSLVAHARTFGYVFNPVSFVVCYGADAATPVAIVADVHNTFGERHAYVLTAPAATGPGRWTAKKVFHVSPFFTLDGTYHFAFDFAADHVEVRIDLHRAGRPVFVSRLVLTPRPLDDRSLAAALLRWPLMTARVISAIHWQALALWRKGLAYHPKPPYDPRAASHTRP